MLHGCAGMTAQCYSKWTACFGEAKLRGGDVEWLQGKTVIARTKVPAHTRDAVLCEAGYMCGNPRCRHILTLELHHIVWVRDGGGNEPANLLCLCPNCHALHTAGHIPQSAILNWKGALEALNHAFNREARDLLLFLHATDSKSIWYTGDGLLRFASLISAGLVEIAEIRHGEGIRGKREGILFGDYHIDETPPLTACMVRLSERGQHLVKAWLAGEAISPLA